MIGFEFETSDLVVKAPAHTLEMHVPFLVGTGWGLYLDVMLSPMELTGNASSKFRSWGDVEFVVDAVPETGQLDRLNVTFNEISRFVANLYKAKPWTSKDVLLHKVDFGPGVNWSPQVLKATEENRKLITIEIRQKVVTAAPQVTAGLKLGALLPLIEYMGREVKPGDFRIDFLGKARTTARQKIYSAAAGLASLRTLPDRYSPLQQQEYQGAVAQLSDVIVWARVLKDVGHEKYLTPLLSRTNYGQLPEFIRQHRNFKKDVVECAAVLLDKGAGVTLLRTDPFLNKTQPSALTVGQWLQAIIMGEDPLRWGQKKGDPRWLPQLVGPERNQGWGMVFEFRGIEEGLPVDDWKRFATSKVPFIAGVNDGVRTSANVNVMQYGLDYLDSSQFPPPQAPAQDDDIEWGAFQSAPQPGPPVASAPPPRLVRSNSFSLPTAPKPKLTRTGSLTQLPSSFKKPE